MGERLPSELDATTLAHFGFSVSNKAENVCKACGQLAKGGRDRCCPQYRNQDRERKRVVHNMELELEHGQFEHDML